MQLNLAVVYGTITNEPVCRELADGSTIVQFDVRTTVERPSNETVPRTAITASSTAAAASNAGSSAWRPHAESHRTRCRATERRRWRPSRETLG